MTLIANQTKSILISSDLSELRVAVLEEGQTVEALIERRGQGSIAGNIYKGRVDNVLPGMEAAFVDIGLEKNGFLYVNEVVLPDVDRKERRRQRIQELLKPGQEVLVQVVKDPMGSKGARVTMELSLAGRFVVFAPDGEGYGVSKRLPDGERTRLRNAAKKLDASDCGVIVRTAAAGATEEDLERDLRFLRRMWGQVEHRAASASCPSLVYAEADLSLKVIRDLLSTNVDRVLIDSERQHRRILNWVRTIQPDLVDRIQLYSEVTPLFEAYGVDRAIYSTLNRRVDLPSGGYLIFDYAEAFTVIDVNTGRFVGKSRLEDTITRNNIEAAREVVRQLRLRDIGGIIVVDFIDMASAKNRADVLKVLQSELERDRTKTYVVEISPLGLVEMTRQNVTEGVREILTRTCPSCGGEGVVLSEDTMAVEAERCLRKLARASGSDAFLIRLNARVASRLAGPGGTKLIELEDETGKRFSLEPVERLPLEEVDVVADGSRAEIAGESHPVKEGQELKLRIAEPHMYNLTDGIGYVDSYPVVVGGAIGYVGQQQKVRIDRVSRHTAYASLVDSPSTAATLPPIGGDGEWELPEPEREVGERLELDERRKARTRKAPARKPSKPTADEAQEQAESGGEDGEATAEPKPKPRRSRAKKPAAEPAASEAAAEDAPADTQAAEGDAEPAAPKRRRSRGGRGRGKTTVTDADGTLEAAEAAGEPAAEQPAAGAEGAPEQDGEAGEAAAARRRRGRRGGRGRGKATAAQAADGDASAATAPADEPVAPAAETVAETPAASAEKPAPKPRTRRPRTPAAAATADGAANDGAPSDGAPAPTPTEPAPAPAAEPAAAPPQVDGARSADGGDARRGLLGKLLGT